MTDHEAQAEALQIAIRALTYYADETHWSDDDWGVLSVISGHEYGEPGKKARNAIKRITKLLR
jgi:hypothetical protein